MLICRIYSVAWGLGVQVGFNVTVFAGVRHGMV
jgi:hypothetical protein